LVSSINKTDRPQYTDNWNTVESGVKYHNKKTHLQETSIQNNNHDKDMEDK
jgi:hypothetical protein